MERNHSALGSPFFAAAKHNRSNQAEWNCVVNALRGGVERFCGLTLIEVVDQSTSDNAYLEQGAFIPSYLCNATQCFDPVYGERFTVETERSTHEFRIATPDDRRLRFIGGVFYNVAPGLPMQGGAVLSVLVGVGFWFTRIPDPADKPALQGEA